MATGLWTYTPNNTAIKSLASSAKDTFEITVTDGIEMDSKDLVVNKTNASNYSEFKIFKKEILLLNPQKKINSFFSKRLEI